MILDTKKPKGTNGGKYQNVRVSRDSHATLRKVSALTGHSITHLANLAVAEFAVNVRIKRGA